MDVSAYIHTSIPWQDRGSGTLTESSSGTLRIQWSQIWGYLGVFLSGVEWPIQSRKVILWFGERIFDNPLFEALAAGWRNRKYSFQSELRTENYVSDSSVLFDAFEFIVWICTWEVFRLFAFSRDCISDRFMGVGSSCTEWQSDISFNLAHWDPRTAPNDIYYQFYVGMLFCKSENNPGNALLGSHPSPAPNSRPLIIRNDVRDQRLPQLYVIFRASPRSKRWENTEYLWNFVTKCFSSSESLRSIRRIEATDRDIEVVPVRPSLIHRFDRA
jgi:hypothetical protein